MNMYAVELFFDQATEQQLYSIWRGLSEAGINSSMINIDGCHPHISLGVFRGDIDEEVVKGLFSDFATRPSAFDVALEAIGTFPTSGTLFISPTVTAQLLQLHKDFHTAFAPLAAYAAEYYLPDKWVPHCTVGIRLTPEVVVQAIQYCYEHFGTGFHGQIAEIGLVKIYYDEEKNCTATPKILSVKL